MRNLLGADAVTGMLLHLTTLRSLVGYNLFNKVV